MTVTSLKTSRAIYQALEWENTNYIWMDLNDTQPFVSDGKVPGIHKADGSVGRYCDAFPVLDDWLPAYDLDYLLQRLPESQRGGHFADYWLSMRKYDQRGYEYGYRKWVDDKDWLYKVSADNPTEAGGFLVIKLIENGVLKKGGES